MDTPREPPHEADEPLRLGSALLRSRLLVGTGKYASFDQMARALEISGTDCVTVAVRRVNLDASRGPSLLDHVDRRRYQILPNTAGCFDAATAVRTAVLARELLGTDLVKLEVLGDPKTLLPDPVGTLEATRELVSQGFTVLVYCSDDPRLAVRLEEAGAASVMPAGSPIGSGQGVLNPNAIRITLELVRVPVIVDAGVGTASDVAIAMELGAAGVLLNTGIALAREPLRMAAAMRDACRAGRNAFLAGRIERKLYANASSPPEGVVGGVVGSVIGGAAGETPAPGEPPLAAKRTS
ncbi:MAG TPA: thiazole synthase [Planctomycetota bacterium]|nr:thiazole synthase [Planctomycetota bacterium]